jgi:hypothetical protein
MIEINSKCLPCISLCSLYQQSSILAYFITILYYNCKFFIKLTIGWIKFNAEKSENINKLIFGRQF